MFSCVNRCSLNLFAYFFALFCLLFILFLISQNINENGEGKISKASQKGLPEKTDWNQNKKPIFKSEYLSEEKLKPENFKLFTTFNDLVLRFSSEDKMLDFIKRAESSGMVVVSNISTLLTARVRVVDSQKANSALSGNDSISKINYNHAVSTPRIPRLIESGSGNGFLGSAAKWLGAREDRHEWGNGITVAVLDSGVDLNSRHLMNFNFEEISLVPKTSARVGGHGTAVSSIIAGQTKDLLGIAPSATILSIRVLNELGEGDAYTVANGIVTAVERGADLINLSLGGYEESPVLRHAVNYAYENGVILVAAAGNDGMNQVTYPARYENVVGVGAVDANGRSSFFSNYGEGIDLAAPGVEVDAAWVEDEMISFSGTSSATAFVTGAFAAILSLEKELSGNDTKNLIYNFANESEKPGFDHWTGHGNLNLGRILTRDHAGIHDAALVGYYFSPDDLLSAGHGGTVPFLVSVQNQGTTWINSLKLEVFYKGLKRDFILGNLEPGRTRSEQLYIEGEYWKEGVEVTSKVSIIGETDSNPENDFRKSRLSFTE